MKTVEYRHDCDDDDDDDDDEDDDRLLHAMLHAPPHPVEHLQRMRPVEHVQHLSAENAGGISTTTKNGQVY